MSDLAEFLLARFADDEEVARAANQRVGGASAKVSPAPLYELNEWGTAETADFGHRFDPARVLAECEAKRRIVRQLLHILRYGVDDNVDAERLLRLLALPYADHPDFREEWRPFASREEMLNALLDEEIRAYRRPGMTAGQLAPLLSSDELRSVYWDRKIREYADANGYDPDADA